MTSHYIDETIEFLVRRAEATFGFNFWVFSHHAQGHWHAEPLTMVQHDPGDYVQPCAHISQQQAQNLMDSLWDAGVRPSEGTGSAGAMAATERHRDDLRSLVFDHLLPHLNLEKPGG